MGSSANTPDIRVRLTADGVADVIAALARVRAESHKIDGGGVHLLTSAFEQLGEVLPAITLGLVIEQVVEMGKHALETAENLSKLSQKTGVSAGTLSVFGLAAKETGTEMEKVDVALVKLAKSTADAADGAKKPLKAFQDLGISVQDLKSKTPDQVLVAVATGLSQIESPAMRAQAAVSLFGKAGAQLIPLFNQIAEEGFGSLEEKAKRLGVYLGEDFAEKARLSKIAVADLSAAVQGAAMQFVNGAIPAVDGLADALSVLAGGGDGFYHLGQTIGAGVIYITSGFVSLTEQITIAANSFDLFANRGRLAVDQVLSVTALTEAAREAARTNSANDEAQIASDKNTINQAKADAAKAQRELSESYGNIYKDPKSYKHLNLGIAPPEGNGKDKDQSAKDANARAAYLQSLADNELAINKTKNLIQDGEDKRAYAAGLLSLDQYYDARAARLATTAAEEESALRQKASAAANLPQQNTEQRYKRLQELAKFQTQIDDNELKSQGELRANEEERSAARIAQATKELEITRTLQSAAGQKDAAAETGLKIEINKYEELLVKQGLSTKEINKQSEAYRRRGQAKIDYDKTQEAAAKVSGDYSAAGSLVNAQVGSGRITGYQGEVEKLAIQQEELEKLKAIGEEMTLNAIASADPGAIETANRFNDSLVVQEESLKHLTTAAVEFRNELSTTGRAALTGFFASMIDGSKTASQSLADLGKAFEGIVANMVSQLIVFYTLESLVGWIAPNSDFASSLSSAGPFGKFAGGGYTGDVPTNKVAGIVHGQEWVSSAETTKKYRPMLEAMAGGSMPATSTASAVQAGMNLGAVMIPATALQTASAASEAAAASSGPLVALTVENHTGQPTSQSSARGSNGQEMIKLVVGAVATNIAQGGVVGKQIQTTFGSVRQGR